LREKGWRRKEKKGKIRPAKKPSERKREKDKVKSKAFPVLGRRSFRRLYQKLENVGSGGLTFFQLAWNGSLSSAEKGEKKRLSFMEVGYLNRFGEEKRGAK